MEFRPMRRKRQELPKEEYFHSAVEGHKVDVIALVRSFRPIPIDEFDNIAQPLI